MNSGSGSDAPIINIFEVITNDLTASNLKNYLCALRNEEKKLYGFNTVPFLINADCGRNILLACLHAYNNESYTEYIKRMLNDLYNKKEHDKSKVIIGWCYGHSIRAVCQYVKDKKFVMSCQCKCCDKKILSKFAIKIWNNVRIQETLYDAEVKARLWHWILEQKTLKLQNLEIDISKVSNLTFLDLEHDFNDEEISDLDKSLDKEDINNISEIYEDLLQNNNQDNEFQQFHWNYSLNNEIILQIFEEYENNYILYFPLINLSVPTVGFNINGIHNPLFNTNLQQYLKNTWWKTLVLWGNVVTQLRERSRRTTATIEVENKIIKYYDIKQRNLDLDRYLHERTNALKANQLLVADKLINHRLV
jgi:hypothetical protein